MKVNDYTVMYRAEPEGGFTVIVPSLPGCVSYGKTLDQAKAMITDAIVGYIASLKKHNEPVPSDSSTFVSTIHISDQGQSAVYA